MMDNQNMGDIEGLAQAIHEDSQRACVLTIGRPVGWLAAKWVDLGERYKECRRLQARFMLERINR